MDLNFMIVKHTLDCSYLKSINFLPKISPKSLNGKTEWLEQDYHVVFLAAAIRVWAPLKKTHRISNGSVNAHAIQTSPARAFQGSV
jgi:hypothetical protein